MSDAILEDVSENEAEEAVNEEYVNDVRLDAIEALVENRAKEIQSEVDESILPDDDEAIENVDPEPEPETKEETILVKIDGEEVEKPLSEVVKSYQKDSTNGKRMEENALERKRLEKDRTDFEQEKASFKAPAPKPVELNENYVDELSAALDDLSLGDDEEKEAAALKLKELLSERGDNPAIPSEALISEATRQATKNVRMEIDYDNAQNKFVNDYPDIVNDTVLKGMFDKKLDEVIPYSITFDEAFEKAGAEVRQWKTELLKGYVKEDPKPTVSDKVALKERLPREPVSAGRTAVKAPAAKPETTQDVIARMRADRGQPL